MFRGFEKYQDLPQNLKGLAFDFIEKRLFMAKTGWKSILHTLEAHIWDRLDVMVLYINF
jgi:hypothetical protein